MHVIIHASKVDASLNIYIALSIDPIPSYGGEGGCGNVIHNVAHREALLYCKGY